MMKRTAGSLVLLLALVLTGGVAAAQTDYPPSTVGEPPPGGSTVSFTSSGPMLPNATVDLTVSSSAIVAERSYSGTLQSHPISLPTTVATRNGSVVFANVTLPADWETSASHSLTLMDVLSGQTLGSDSFFVTASGQVLDTAPSNQSDGGSSGSGGGSGSSAGSGLPRTGSDTDLPIKVAVGLIAAGGLAVLTVRKRAAATVG